MKTFLTIAGSDCIGGAGIQADIKTATALKLYSTSVVTCVTAQNSCGVISCMPVPENILIDQLNAVLDDITPDCIKIGVIPTVESALTIASFLSEKIQKGVQLPIIVTDTVLSPTLGKRFTTDIISLAKCISENLAPLSTVMTPNAKELQTMKEAIGMPNSSDIEFAEFVRLKNLIVTGGNEDNELCTDILYCINNRININNRQSSDAEVFRTTSTKVKTKNHHGTGCVYSSALACNLALGYNMREAFVEAHNFIYNSLLHYSDIKFGKGYGPANFFI